MQGDLKTAVSYYKSSLDIDPNFEPAITRLQVIQCLLLFDDKKTAMSEILWSLPWFQDFSQIWCNDISMNYCVFFILL